MRSAHWVCGMLAAVALVACPVEAVPTVAGLELWLDANQGVNETAGAINSWTDQAGGNVFTVTSGARALTAHLVSPQGLHSSNEAVRIAPHPGRESTALRGSRLLLTHGETAAKQSFLLDYDNAVNHLIGTRDVAATQAMMVEAAERAEFGD